MSGKPKDLTGLRLGRLTVLEPTAARVRNATVWRCRCDCGNEVLLESRKLKPGVVYSCGCEAPPGAEGNGSASPKDLTGLRFGKLLVLGKSGSRAPDRNPLWLCRCDCGKEIETMKRRLLSGGVQSCGCGRTPPLKDWVGKRFGKLTVLSYAGKEGGAHLWHCRCDCGNETDVRQSNLQDGRTTSCGCLRDPTKHLTYVGGTCVELLTANGRTRRNNTSGVRGVYFNSRRGNWRAQIVFRQKCYNLGNYARLEDAAKARAAAEERIYGDFLAWYEENYQNGRETTAKAAVSNG